MNEAIIQRNTRAILVAHFDAGASAFLERQLTFVRAKVLETEYEDLIARSFIPIATDIPETADTYAWAVLDSTGKAKVIAAGSDDLPRVDVSAEERTGKVVRVGASYGWELDELAEAARLGIPLLDRKAAAARRAIELEIDNLLATGDTSSQTNLPFTGFINNADVEALGIVNPTGDAWTNATTAASILQTLNDMVSEVVTDVANIQKLMPDTILLPTREFMVAAQVKVDTTNDKTVLRSFLENNPFIKNIAPWHKLTLAGAGGTTSRAVIYKRDPLVLEGIVPMDFRQLAPQARNLEMVVPCKGRAGGVKVYHPAAMRYADFAQ
jgi:hypothetical protein